MTAEEWIGVLLPGRAPAATEAFRGGLVRLDYQALVMAPEAFAARIRAEQAYWAPIVEASGFRPED